jgi:(p)ppGpp synthase/HD superfamily hydrolase
MNTIEKAYLFAEVAHAGQKYGEKDYMTHIKHVHDIAQIHAFADHIEVACILHDVLEDTNVNYNLIKKHFGEEIADIVYAVTNEIGQNRKEILKKTLPKIKNNPSAIIVKLCDRLANVQSCVENYNKDHKLYLMYQKEYSTFRNELIKCKTFSLYTSNLWEELDDLLDYY